MTEIKKNLKTYRWQGRNKKGKEISGESDVVNDAVLRAFLTKQGLTHIVIKEKPRALIENKGKIKSRDIVFFTRQMATMLRAGIPVLRALDLVGQSIKKPIRMRELVLGVHDDIARGLSFAEGLARHPLYFDRPYISLVSAGEDAGRLDKTMDDIAINLEKVEETKRKVKKALTYPIIVMIFAIIVTAVLMVWVVPVFAEFFHSNGGELPWITQFVVSVSNFFVDKGGYIFLFLVATLVVFRYIQKRNRSVQEWSNKVVFKLPIISGVLRCGAMARFARTMSVLFDAGVPLLRGLEVTAPATGSVMYEKAVYEIREDVKNGQQMSFSMKNTKLFPMITVQMTAIGEESGNLGEMLDRVGKFYEAELDWRIDRLTAMIEPFIMLFLAIVVGGLLMAIYLPIFYLGSLF